MQNWVTGMPYGISNIPWWDDLNLIFDLWAEETQISISELWDPLYIGLFCEIEKKKFTNQSTMIDIS